MNVGLQKTTLVNYPRKVAAAVFLPGCNLRCPYCYNGELVCASVSEGPAGKSLQGGMNDYVPIEAVYEHIEKRKPVLHGLVISGGEALLSPVLPELILRARKAGLAVKLDTNGLLPDRMYSLLHDEALCPDMIAVDIKTAPSRYHELKFCCPAGAEQSAEQPEAALKRTLMILQEKHMFRRRVEIEYRTVLVPPLVAADEIRAISALLPSDAAWFFAPFLPGNCLNPAWNAIRPYTQAETEELIRLAGTKIPNSRLR